MHESIDAFNAIFSAFLPFFIMLIACSKKELIAPTTDLIKRQPWGCREILIVLFGIGTFWSLCKLFLSSFIDSLPTIIIISYAFIVYLTFIIHIFIGKTNLLDAFGFKSKISRESLNSFLKILVLYLSLCGLLLMIKKEAFLEDRAHYWVTINLFDHSFFLIFLVIAKSVFLAPMLEEVIYRALLYKAIIMRYSHKIAVVLTSIIWSTSHFLVFSADYLPSLTSTTITGMVLCYLYAKTQSIIPSIIIHSTINLLSILAYTYIFFR